MKTKVHELRTKTKTDLMKQLDEMKSELASLRVAKVTGGAASKLSKMCGPHLLFALLVGCGLAHVASFAYWMSCERHFVRPVRVRALACSCIPLALMRMRSPGVDMGWTWGGGRVVACPAVGLVAGLLPSAAIAPAAQPLASFRPRARWCPALPC